jgi:hypothetical protein
MVSLELAVLAVFSADTVAVSEVPIGLENLSSLVI